MSLFRPGAWGAMSLQRSLPLAPAGAPTRQPSLPLRHTLPRPRAPGVVVTRGVQGEAHATPADPTSPEIPAVLAREAADGR